MVLNKRYFCNFVSKNKSHQNIYESLKTIPLKEESIICLLSISIFEYFSRKQDDNFNKVVNKFNDNCSKIHKLCFCD